MSEPWRTERVTQICLGIREAGDYSGLPILADALQDEGYDRTETLDLFRAEQDHRMVRQYERELCRVLGGEYWAAVERLEKVADHASDYDDYEGHDHTMTYDALLEAAEGYHLHGERTTQYGGQSWGDALGWGSDTERFWKDYELVTGCTVEGNRRHNFFGCSC